MTTEPTPRPKPISLREPAERYQHVVARMKERGGIDWPVDKVAWLEGRIKHVRQMENLHKSVALILPKKIAEDKIRNVQHWRFLVDGQPHTAIWSQIAKGLVSYVGPGEVMPVISPVTTPPAP